VSPCTPRTRPIAVCAKLSHDRDTSSFPPPRVCKREWTTSTARSRDSRRTRRACGPCKLRHRLPDARRHRCALQRSVSTVPLTRIMRFSRRLYPGYSSQSYRSALAVFWNLAIVSRGLQKILLYYSILTRAQGRGHLRDLLAAFQIRKEMNRGHDRPLGDCCYRPPGRAPESVAPSLPKAAIGHCFTYSAAALIVLIAPRVPSSPPVPTPAPPDARSCLYPWYVARSSSHAHLIPLPALPLSQHREPLPQLSRLRRRAA
jgi:hypothetical protein